MYDTHWNLDGFVGYVCDFYPSWNENLMKAFNFCVEKHKRQKRTPARDILSKVSCGSVAWEAVKNSS